METSMPLASDSFSYSWLSNSKSPIDDGLDEEPHRESVFNSNSLVAECQNFNFDTSSITTHSPVVLVHADELFSDGLLRPVFVDPSTKVEESCNGNTPDPIETKIGSFGSSSFSSRTVSSRTTEIHHGFLTRLRKSTWRTLVDFFRYFNQLRQKVGGSRKSIRVDDIDNTDWKVKSLRSSRSQKESPRPITTHHPIGDLHDDHHESSIYEAVLHCKRSVGIDIYTHAFVLF